VGITFVYVTHDQEEALTMSNRIAVMDRGNVLQIGSPVEIYERPNCRFVADFIGETNFMSGTVKSVDGDSVTVLLDKSNAELVGTRQGELVTGMQAAVSIRPEKVRLAAKPTLSHNCFLGRVVTTAYIGSDTRVIVELDDGTRLRVWEQNKISTLDVEAYYTPGQEIWVVLFPENTLILSEE
jgi:spermidine/putrescine transport system ATP-binding protein